ncbi:MAG: D-sedoheptulose 7-phosphate isomerase [Candidatus Marinimicrobia bacterium]|nr:D-sedoheptulose 7-phosphate isomerase [Candidatus Neomarinimicrobiota bacterium]
MSAIISRDSIQSEIKQQLLESARVKEALSAGCSDSIADAAEMLIAAVAEGAKILLCGNGGSAADAQHIAAELVARLNKERKAIPALALTTNTSTLTALANDYDFATVFVRQVEAFGRSGDILIGISTSGNSKNVIQAMNYAAENGLKTVALTGGSGGEMAQIADFSIIVPSDSVQRIQEAHITIGHILCDLLEQSVIARK